jgi:hypothetical protein
MTALRNSHHADVRAWRDPRRAASPSDYRAPGLRRPPAPRVEFRPPAGRWRPLARALRVGAELLFALWAVAALVFCAAVAVALVR